MGGLMIAWVVCAYLCTGMGMLLISLGTVRSRGLHLHADAPVTLHAQILTVAIAALFWPAFVIIASRK